MSDPAANTGTPVGWLRKAAGRVSWAARKFGYYCLPPAVYDSVRFPGRMILPRMFQPTERLRLRTALHQRLGSPLPPPPPPLPAFTAPPPVPPPPSAPSAPPPPQIDTEAANAYYLYQSYHALPEGTEREIEAKLGRLREVMGGVRYDRVRLYREVARLERLIGRDTKAALYLLRCMRLTGGDRWGDLPWVRATLEANRFPAEAEAAWAMYGPAADRDADRDAECGRILRAARDRWLKPPPLADEYTIWDDRRGDARPRVSVLMTLYNGANKLAHFLSALQLQTLNRRGEMELVIVDSNSPMDEYAAFKQAALAFPIPTLFARTRNRETIQTAWNRAIPLARAPYISLLGVDEAIVPHALERLAGVLDAEPHTDWAQGSILTTEADKYGNQASDIMTYDKTGYTNDLVYLETCYLGPVGAMHRKAVHDRVGYFDSTFRGAGDTEYKNRVLPGLKVTTVPDLLGLYVNFPEERTTQSPTAELEDGRAWYLHRTPAGVRYAFDGRPVEDLERQLVRCLWYRKSYLQKMSTDFALAEAVATVLRERAPDSPVLAAFGPGVEAVARAYRGLDEFPGVRPDVWTAHARAQKDAVLAALADHKRLGRLPADVDYCYVNDNINEQHHWLW